jgi:SnoaL-like protein
VLLYGDAALVLCEEELDGGTLVASNVFVREDGAWRIAHHQAGQLVARRQTSPRPGRPPPPSRLN